MYKLLIIENDKELCESMETNLHEAGFETASTSSCAGALEYIKENEIDLFLLGIMLQDGNGIELCTIIRKISLAPIIFVSSVSDEEYILEAFQRGGDDYVIKPANFRILLARIESLLRRTNTYQVMTHNETLSFNKLKINMKKRLVEYDDRRVLLSTIEYGILLFLIKNMRKTVSAKEIFENVWTKEYNNDARTVVVHISNLRRKLEEISSTHEYIAGVRGKGYTFLPDSVN